MMPRYSTVFTLVLMLSTLLIPSAVEAQTASVAYGSIFVYDPSGSHPTPALGYKVYLFNRSTNWIGPSVTDSYGRFAFYNIPYNIYLLRVYYRNPEDSPFEEQINVPGPINPIVLPHP